jgi:chemotaxis-related protein WspB
MLFVLFHLGPERYALEARRVVEILPLVALKQLPHAPFGVAGMFLYRGRPMPALDLCLLTLGRPAVEHLSTRIIIINQLSPEGTERQIALIAERVTETIQRTEKDFVTTEVRLVADSFLGPLLVDPKNPHRVIQMILPEKLLADQTRALLFAPPAEAEHAAD